MGMCCAPGMWPVWESSADSRTSGLVVSGKGSQVGLRADDGERREKAGGETSLRTYDDAIWIWGFCHGGYVFVVVGCRLAGLLWLFMWTGWSRGGMRRWWVMC